MKLAYLGTQEPTNAAVTLAEDSEGREHGRKAIANGRSTLDSLPQKVDKKRRNKV